MPAVYAHDRFGVLVRHRMNKELHSITEQYNSAYRDGLQGPDIFFFYHPFYKNWVQDYGTHLHHSDAGAFFRHALRVVRRYGRNSSQYAYLLGFICHFTLDSECHPYIEKQTVRSGVAHLEIEAEFEKYLIRKKGLDPLRFPFADLIYQDPETASAIEPFFPSVSQKKVCSSLSGMQLVKRFFGAPVPVRKYLFRPVMKVTGLYHSANGLMIQETDNPLCRESNQKLEELFSASVPLAVSLQEQFDQCLQNGQELPVRFHRTFE